MKFKAFCLTLIVLILASVFPSLSLAATAKEMSVLVWPQYDRSDVLLMNYVFYSEQKTTATMYLPKSVDKTTINGASPDSKNRNEQNPTISAEGNYWKASLPVLYGKGYTEGYFPYTSQGDKKSFTYKFKAAFDVPELFVEFQQPLKATDFKLTPTPTKQFTDNDGYKISYFNYKNVKKGQEYPFSVSYVNSDPQTSSTYKQESGSTFKNPDQQQSSNNSSAAPATNQTSSSGSDTNAFLIAGMLIGMGIVGYAVYTMKAGKEKPAYRSQTGSAKKKSKHPKGQKFCSNCGSSLPGNAKFCSNCGQKSRG